MMFAAVKRYTALGWPVLPLWWVENGRCVCVAHGACKPGSRKHEECTAERCEVCPPGGNSEGKHPIGFVAPRGPHSATTMDAVLFEWWRKYPRANVGIACEKFCVVDIDPRNGGVEWMTGQVGLHKRLPPTPTARTGSGGFHYLFRLPSFELRGGAGPGVDIKKPGGYIVAAPSRTVDLYRWLRPPETPLAELPAWLQALVKAEDPPPRIPVGDITDVALERRIERARAYLEHVDPAIQGQDGSTKTLVAAAHVALGFMLPADHALHAMRDWNQRCQPPWSDRELKRKIDQALKGYRNVQPGQHLTSR